MPSFSPITLAAAVVLALALLGVIIAWIKSAATFRGYREIAADVQAIARALRGEIFRDGADLVIAGNHGSLPTFVRFSHTETTPGLNIRMGAPATLTLTIAAKSVRASDGRAQVRTGSALLDARFSARTDHPNEAKLLLSSKPMLDSVERLCCSTQTLFAVGSANIELSELVIPQYTARHVLAHLEDMAALAATLDKMPGAHAVAVRKLKKEHSSWLLRAAIALGLVGVVLAVVAGSQSRPGRRAAPAVQAAQKLPEGVPPMDAVVIPGLPGWRLAGLEDFDPSAAAWLRGSGRQVSGRVPGDFSGKGLGTDVGYVLLRPDGTWRVVLLVDRENRYDANYKYIGIVARVPKRVVPRINWLGTPPQGLDGDGLLITRKPDDPASGLVLFTSGSRITSGVPVNYQSISLE